jgi:hypothetical protein
MSAAMTIRASKTLAHQGIVYALLEQWIINALATFGEQAAQFLDLSIETFDRFCKCLCTWAAGRCAELGWCWHESKSYPMNQKRGDRGVR